MNVSVPSSIFWRMAIAAFIERSATSHTLGLHSGLTVGQHLKIGLVVHWASLCHLLLRFPRAGQDPSVILQTLEVRFSEARLLDSLLETTTKTIFIKLNVAEMNQEGMDEFVKVLKENPGKQNYKIHLFDPIGKKSCNMTPIKGAVNAQEVLPLLEKMPFVEFDLR